MAVLAVFVIASPMSVPVMIGLVLLATIPPALAWSLWNPPSPTMSERIRKELQ